MMSGLPYPSALLGDPKAKPRPLPTRQGPTWPHLQNATLPSLARPRGTLQTELPCCPHWASRAHSQDRVLAPRSATAGAGGTDKQGSSVVTRHLPAWNSVSPPAVRGAQKAPESRQEAFQPRSGHRGGRQHSHVPTCTCTHSPSCPRDYHQDPHFSDTRAEMQREAGRAPGFLGGRGPLEAMPALLQVLAISALPSGLGTWGGGGAGETQREELDVSNNRGQTEPWPHGGQQPPGPPSPLPELNQAPKQAPSSAYL